MPQKALNETDWGTSLQVMHRSGIYTQPLTLENVAGVLKTILSRARGPGNLRVPAFRGASAPEISVKCEPTGVVLLSRDDPPDFAACAGRNHDVWTPA
jgi:hypothetical protein